MKGKKEAPQEQEQSAAQETQSISTSGELKSFLTSVRDKMVDQVAAPIYGLTAINHVMNLENIYQLLDEENKQLSREIWLRLKKAGFQLKSPPLLFALEEDGVSPAAS